jgi:hypothetical protein
MLTDILIVPTAIIIFVGTYTAILFVYGAPFIIAWKIFQKIGNF